MIVSYGAGTNSKAMVCGMVRRGEQIDALVFCDPGGERPETYADLEDFSQWLQQHGYPKILTVQRVAKVGDEIATTLEQECLMRGQLPGIAYGFGSCSDKWKQQPFKHWLKSTGWTDVVVCIGFGAEEPHRAERGDKYDSGYKKRYPLIEWGMDREACMAEIAAAGLSQPGKSACFFCPSSKKHEILALKKTHPDLFFRAVEIEKAADLNLTTIKGLGRRFSWAELAEADERQRQLFEDGTAEIPCGCFDG